jgi:membrane protease YdiL (CAAX protease family)
MKPTALFFAYLFACLVLGAALTYPVMQTGWVDADPHRVMGRLAQVFILLGLWPFLKVMGLDDRAALGYGAQRPVFLRALGAGWVWGVLILLVLAVTLLALQVRVPDRLGEQWVPDLAKKALQALIGGLLIGLMEETFFRGALFAAIRRRGSLRSAVIWTALLYSLVHFMKPGTLPEGTAFDWNGAWQMFLQVFTGAFQWKHFDSVIALFLVGVFLGLVRERTGHIGWCIGMHAGWVLVIQVTRHLTDGNQSSPFAPLAGQYDGMIGWLAAGWIGVLALGYWRLSWSRSGTQSKSWDV